MLLLLPVGGVRLEARPAADPSVGRPHLGRRLCVGAVRAGLKGHEVLGRLREGLLALVGHQGEALWGDAAPFECVAKVDGGEKAVEGEGL